MPFLKLPNFKLGINPSVRSKFDPLALTGTQKVQLASSRIFGTAIGGNLRSGNKVLQKKFSPNKELDEFNTYAYDVQRGFPMIQFYEERERHKMMLELRKMRIVMRGVKIGKQKGGSKVSFADVFDKNEEEEEDTTY